MDQDVLTAIRELVTGQRALALAVVLDGEPEASLLPYAFRPDFGAFYVQASGLARHARGLVPGGRVGVLIHANDAAAEDPLQIHRLSLQVSVAVLDRDGAAFAKASAWFLDRFPGAAMTLSLGDFNLYELTPVRGRFVAGFGRAYNVDTDDLRAAATS